MHTHTLQRKSVLTGDGLICSFAHAAHPRSSGTALQWAGKSLVSAALLFARYHNGGSSVVVSRPHSTAIPTNYPVRHLSQGEDEVVGVGVGGLLS